MQGILVEVVAIGHLDDLADVHDRDPVADVPHDGQVVGDKQVGEVVARLEVLEQIDDLSLDRHVEGADRLIADDELRVEHKGPGDADALPLAATELVRVTICEVRVQTHDAEHLADLLVLLLTLGDVMDLQRLGDDAAHGHAGIQRREWVLENHLHVAPIGNQVVRAELGYVLALVIHDAFGRLIDLQNGAASGGFTTAALSHQSEGLTALDVERDVIDGVNVADRPLDEQAATHGEVHFQVPDFEETVRVLRGGCQCGCRIDRHLSSLLQPCLRRRRPSRRRHGRRPPIRAMDSPRRSARRRRCTAPGTGTYARS